ncbi:MAG: hypothetical protein WC860_02465 [Candidatus Margulisiibacteriota bacterium]|jgi:tetratricopeptide (TPR) repeat protein
MSIFVCAKCQKEVLEEKAILHRGIFFCAVCKSPLSYFGRESVRLSSPERLARYKAPVDDDKPVRRSISFDRPDIDLNILECEDALKINPDNFKAMNTLGLLYKVKKNFKIAEKWFKQALSIKINYHDAFFNLIELYTEQKEYEKAITELEKYKEIDPENYFLDYNLGLVNYQKNNLAKALEHFQNVYTNIKNKDLAAASEKYISLIIDLQKK